MSSAITADIAGLDALIRDLQALEGDLAPLMDAARSAGELVRFEGRNYPSEPPGSTYTRTYELRDGWADVEVSARPNVVEAEIYNTVDYAVWVYGPNQAQVHEGRWPTDEELVTRNEADIEALMEQGAATWLGAHGL